MARFLSTKSQNTLFWSILRYFAEKQKGVNFQFFIKNRGLSPLEKCEIFDFLKSTFFWFKMDSCQARTSQNTLFRII